MAEVLFVGEDYLRDIIPGKTNLDIQDVINNVSFAQDISIESIISSDFYIALQAAYSANTLTADETVLMLNYIKPVVAYKAIAESLPFIYTPISSKGPQLLNGDNSTSIDASHFYYLKKELNNRCDWYTNRLTTYLRINKDLFPLFVNNDPTENIQSDLTNQNDLGFATYDDEYFQYCFKRYGGSI